ncbi:hypothetical protein SEVIR_7G273751v4 [Setaria viridis]|uniref:Leucine-rich repeat-containing N-terminal plant-type domain-containing protein n=1 Tax=Setaria viridis TaxID=4556 RepID=A0A4U6TYQ3_SETVI|nr:hypothetical protein SEVIR_7G273751v2 [Setaria viridis]
MMSGSFPFKILFWVLCILQCMPNITFGCVPEERIALMHTQSSLMKSNSEVPSSWGQSDDCCSWESVTCNDDSTRVSGLHLFGIHEGGPWNLNLEIFSQFHELLLLDLSWNMLSGLQNIDVETSTRMMISWDLSENSLLLKSSILL